MRWIKRKICNWLGVEQFDEWGAVEEVTPLRCRNDAPTFFDRNPETNFRIYNASGGIILEVGRWDKTKQEWIEIFKTELRLREQENRQLV